MNNNSRLYNAICNVGIGGVLQFLALILTFFSRTLFVEYLGIEYLSLDGLFANILTILNFSELGIGSAIIYSLYKPIAEGDKRKVIALMHLFRNAYRFIILAIIILGVSVMPMLKYIVSDIPDVKEDLSFIYSLFLINTILTYVWGYKKSFLVANQENYRVQLIYHCVHAIQITIQIAVLYFTHNYILYLLILMIGTISNNIISTLYVNYKYPWLSSFINSKLDKAEKKGIFSNIKAIAMYKFGAVMLNGTNNIIISVCIKTTLVGLCSNYFLIINSINMVINQALSGLMASIGNFSVKATPSENRSIFQKLDFFTFWLISYICIGLCAYTNALIEIWLGSSYIMEDYVLYILIASFYVMIMNSIPSTFRYALGLFEKAKYFPLLASIINITTGSILSFYCGIIGVFIGNIVSRFTCYTLVDASIVFRKVFEDKLREYYLTYFLRILFCIAVISLCVIARNWGYVGEPKTIHSLIIHTITYTLLYNILFIFIFWKSAGMKYLFVLIKKHCHL